MRPCTCDRCQIGAPYRKGDCPRCWAYHNRPEWRAYYDGPWEEKAKLALAETKAAAKPRCKHLGEKPTGVLHQCPDAACKKKEYPCAVFGVCVLSASIPGVHGCRGEDGKGCPSYVAADASPPPAAAAKADAKPRFVKIKIDALARTMGMVAPRFKKVQSAG